MFYVSDLLNSILHERSGDDQDILAEHHRKWPLNLASLGQPEPQKSQRVRLRRAIEDMQAQGLSVCSVEPRHRRPEPDKADVHISWIHRRKPLRGTLKVVRRRRSSISYQQLQALLNRHGLPAVMTVADELVIYDHMPQDLGEMLLLECGVVDADWARDEGIAAGEFAQRVLNGESAQEARIWMTEGISLTQSEAWKQVLSKAWPASNAPEDMALQAVQWKQLIGDPDSASAWIRAGIQYARTAESWRSAGFLPTEARAWTHVGCTSESARALRGRGMTVRQVRSAIGLTEQIKIRARTLLHNSPLVRLRF